MAETDKKLLTIRVGMIKRATSVSDKDVDIKVDWDFPLSAISGLNVSRTFTISDVTRQKRHVYLKFPHRSEIMRPKWIWQSPLVPCSWVKWIKIFSLVYKYPLQEINLLSIWSQIKRTPLTSSEWGVSVISIRIQLFSSISRWRLEYKKHFLTKEIVILACDRIAGGKSSVEIAVQRSVHLRLERYPRYLA